MFGKIVICWIFGRDVMTVDTQNMSSIVSQDLPGKWAIRNEISSSNENHDELLTLEQGRRVLVLGCFSEVVGMTWRQNGL